MDYWAAQLSEETEDLARAEYDTEMGAYAAEDPVYEAGDLVLLTDEELEAAVERAA